jgi:hypothetical protein
MEHEAEVERIANTESLFREVNEHIAESAQRFQSAAADFVCECGDTACTERVEATLEEYEEVREDGTAFLLAPGHEDSRVEATVEREDDRAVVRKRHPVAAALARRLNPRAAGET